jgi:DNA-nicking Smr family endonuclease
MTSRPPKKPTKKPAGPSPEDSDLWHKAMQDVKPMNAAHREKEKMTAPSLKKAEKPQITKDRQAGHSAEPPPASSKSLDKRTEARFRKGEMQIDAALDLHGHTQHSAHARLRSFVLDAASAGKRCLLIVTGKGKGAEGGVLRRALPHWLEAPDLSLYILSIAPAKIRHGAEGAFYVLLRRKRT